MAKDFGPDRIFVNASSYKVAPAMVDQRLSDLSDEEAARVLYPGCRVRTLLGAYGYNTNGNGVTFGLNAIQKVNDGKRLDSRVRGQDVFTAVDGSSPFTEAAGDADPPAEDDFLS